MRFGWVRAAYNLVLPPLLIAALPAQWRKMRRRGGTARDLIERMGWYKPSTLARFNRLHKPWWIHAVSVGEVLVAAKFIAALRAERPGQPVMLSTTTTTGRLVAEREIPRDVPIIYNPVDLPGAVRRAFDAARPGRLVLVEAEVWPNWLHIAHQAGLEVDLINARLSPRSERRFKALRWMISPMLAQLDRVLVPEPEDIGRWSAIGVRRETISVTGSLKHDYAGWPGDPRTSQFGAWMQSLWGSRDGRPPILLAASTHPGEEALIAGVFLKLRSRHPSLRLILVPRHVERASNVTMEMKNLGLRVIRRSHAMPGGAIPDMPSSPSESPDILLVDTTGELRAWYPLADAVVIGKSFLTQGGQNPVEALMAGRPVITGPHMENFGALMKSLTRHAAILQVSDADSLVPAIERVLTSPELASQLVTAARTAMAPHQGAARRSARILLDACP